MVCGLIFLEPNKGENENENSPPGHVAKTSFVAGALCPSYCRLTLV